MNNSYRDWIRKNVNCKFDYFCLRDGPGHWTIDNAEQFDSLCALEKISYSTSLIDYP